MNVTHQVYAQVLHTRLRVHVAPNGVSVPAMSWGRLVSSIVITCAACSDVTNQLLDDPSTRLAENVFRCNVQPVLARQCSYNACHGNAGSPLRIYTPGKLRASAPADIDAAIAPLTEA